MEDKDREKIEAKAAREAQKAEARARKEAERAAKKQAWEEARAAYWKAKQEAKAAKAARKAEEKAAKEARLMVEKKTGQPETLAKKEAEFDEIKEAWESSKAVYEKTKQETGVTGVQDVKSEVAEPTELTKEGAEQQVTPKAGIFNEIEENFQMAQNCQADKPVPFKTEVWETKGQSIRGLGLELQYELAEVYTDIYLANNLIWLLTEINSGNQKLTTAYAELCSKIAERLKKFS